VVPGDLAGQDPYHAVRPAEGGGHRRRAREDVASSIKSAEESLSFGGMSSPERYFLEFDDGDPGQDKTLEAHILMEITPGLYSCRRVGPNNLR
jgi:hypothetical protein